MFGIEGVWGDAARIAVIIGSAYVLVLWVAAVVWTYRDIASRTRDPFSQTVALVLVLVFSLPGLLAVPDPAAEADTIADQYDRQLEAEALLHEIQEQATCPSCRRKIEDDFIACPYCRTSLRVPCELVRQGARDDVGALPVTARRRAPASPPSASRWLQWPARWPRLRTQRQQRRARSAPARRARRRTRHQQPPRLLIHLQTPQAPR